MSNRRKYGWAAAGLVALVAAGWLVLLLVPAGRNTGRFNQDQAGFFIDQGYACFFFLT